MKKKYSLILGLSMLLLANRETKAQTTDDVLNLLINKNLIQQADADSIRAEFAIKQQDAKEKQKSFNITGKKAIQISGYTQVRFQSFQEAGKPDALDIRRARLDFRGAITPTWDYRLQLEFATAPKILDATITFKPYDYLKVQAGQFKVPFSMENLAQSNNMESIDRSQVVEALVARGKDVIGNHNGRDIGLQVFGSAFKLKEKFILDYFVAGFNGQGINTTDINESKDFAGRIVLHPITGLDIGGSTYIGFDKIGTPTAKDQVRNRFGGELAYTWKNLNVKGEYIEGQDASVKKFGYYAQVSYFIFPKKFQILAKYDAFDPDKDKEDKISNQISNWYIGGLTYFFNEWAKLAVNYTYKSEKGTKINNDLISAQAQISF
ncbi:MAG TPA: porin [Bacteroidia bacterium]|nr:porin [Bacteroidia bacterium]